MSTLVIVESPAKAKTIAGYLGKGYDVHASFGHVRDLPERADEVPPEYKKIKWAKLGVNVEGNPPSFEPLYVVPEDKKRHVATLRAAAKNADALLLATDEDREGESISWHIVQVLKPPKSMPVKRIVFHEITPEAIKAAIQNPREIDDALVKAQETRRMLDRLYGYTLSPVLWKKVAPKLSAGRVQSVAVRLLVERERERRAFRSATYWDLEAQLQGDGQEGSFRTRLINVDGRPIASGKSFDATTGALADTNVVLLDEARARSLASAALAAKRFKVVKLETRPEQERPPVPFMTSTLQQEANRKLRFSSKRTMQIAQQLYEGIDLDGQRTGLITYMRTDSLSLSERALSECRQVIEQLYGRDYLPAEPVRYRTKSKNAQEAHEAIRPTDLTRRPEDLRAYLDPDQYRLYELIWKRTVACQMVPARVLRTQVQVEVTASDGLPTPSTMRFSASGKQIAFPGFLRAYVEGSDDPEAELQGQETLLPQLSEGQTLSALTVDPKDHTTKPPARLTEASLVKRLEELGIGRPSTYASIIGTVIDRGYVFKNGNELVPTFTAFAVTELLERHFAKLVDVRFTAKMEDELDEIAGGERDWVSYLDAFYRGEPQDPGIAQAVEERTPEIPFPAIELGTDPDSGEPIIVKVGRFGTYVQRGSGGPGNTASIPDDTIPADLTLEKVLELLRKKSQGPKVVGKDPSTGRDVVLRTGRFGSYLEVAQTEDEASSGEKPRRASLPEDVSPDNITQDDVTALFGFPRGLGTHPESGEEISVNLGRYGAYVRCGKETRNVPSWREAAKLTMEQALALLAQPKLRGRGRGAGAVRTPLKEFGAVEGAAGPVRIFEGRYGPYVSDGTTNASLPKGADVQAFTVEEAMSLLRARAAAAPPKKGARGRRGAAAKSAAEPKAAVAKTSARKAPARKAAASDDAASDDAGEAPAKKATKTAGKSTAGKKAAGKTATKRATASEKA